MPRKTKAQLQEEIEEMMKVQLDMINQLRTKDQLEKLTFMARVKLREEMCLKQIQHAIEDCYDRTGRQPNFDHVEINRPAQGTRLRASLPKVCYDNEMSKDYPQTNAVKELVDWCMANGEWTSRRMCKSWIRDRLRSQKI